MQSSREPGREAQQGCTSAMTCPNRAGALPPTNPIAVLTGYTASLSGSLLSNSMR